MTTSWITVAKTAGPAAEKIIGLICKWHSTTHHVEPSTRHSDEETEPVIGDRGTSLLQELEHNATSPSVLFFQKYVDPWSMVIEELTFRLSECSSFFVGPVKSERIECAALRIPSRSDGYTLVKLLASTRPPKRPLYAESRQFVDVLIRSIQRWRFVLPQEMMTAVIVGVNRLSVSWLDGDVLSAATKSPTWLARLEAGDGREKSAMP